MVSLIFFVDWNIMFTLTIVFEETIPSGHWPIPFFSVYDYGFASNICVQCIYLSLFQDKNKNTPKSLIGLERGMLRTVLIQCTQNRTGSSGAMKKDTVRRIWNNSLSYNLG